jgi:hypothetical protein
MSTTPSGRKFVGWTRRPGERWRPVIEGSEEEVWTALLAIRDAPDKCVCRSGKNPNEKRIRCAPESEVPSSAS